jgi:hypothetical protein
MNLIIAIILLHIAIFFAKWSRWKEYYPTLLFIGVCNLFYNYIVNEQHLWKFKSSLVPHEVMDIVYTFTFNPTMTIIFLSYHPRGWWRMLLYWVSWTILFSVMEYVQFVTHHIEYFRGWNIPWTILFYAVMFPDIVAALSKALTCTRYIYSNYKRNLEPLLDSSGKSCCIRPLRFSIYTQYPGKVTKKVESDTCP